MSEAFVGEVRMFGFNFAPLGWALCNGQLLPISQNTALFSILGTTYGGDGRSTFGLPNLQGQAALGAGSGPGLSPRFLGETAGVTTVTLSQATTPVHNHVVQGLAQPANLQTPTSADANSATPGEGVYSAGAAVNVQMAAAMLGPFGGGGPHTNLQPYLVVNFCIAMKGVFPSRN